MSDIVIMARVRATDKPSAARRPSQLSANGLRPYPGTPPRPIQSEQVTLAAAFLSMLRPIKRRRYISNGALIVAALSLEFTVRPYRASPNAGIGVSQRDLRRLMEVRP
ncbi:hypothetical protein [Bradyrhizobium sp. WD16]|uniref:hypothetical protein n=1 Tax=Bradyrhizobium sp. WD16 TaxID=1521768 RepID=UPI0020A4F7D2|nr:hypothetical protein [Bradyrhizobium sp. WD16]UTD28912.1 hypothetical protein DB459_20480 [Bradyrhizobium sp. WD16]